MEIELQVELKPTAKRSLVSCFECRKLKLKCDRNFPCCACRRRGVAAVCPNGGGDTSKKNRVILANVPTLSTKIDQMQDRVVALEQALRDASSSTHPLFSEEPGQSPSVASDQESSSVAESIDAAVGTLTIADNGGSQWYGNHATSEHLVEKSEEEEPFDAAPLLPPDITFLANCYPMFVLHSRDEELLFQLRTLIRPPPDDALPIVKAYFEYSAPIWSPVSQETFLQDTWATVYDDTRPVPDEHLALFYIILALGVLSDERRSMHSNEADMYHLACRATLSLGCTVHFATVTTIQTLVLLCHYLQISSRRSARDELWIILGVAVKVAESLSLHVDPEQLDPHDVKLSDDDKELRRRVFWELYSFTIMQSNAFGRPPDLISSCVGCAIPKLPEECDESGKYTPSSHGFKHYFLRDFVVPAIDEALSDAKRPPTYAMILEMDRTVRETCITPPNLLIDGLPDQGFGVSAAALKLQRYIALFVREFHIMYLHRAYCSRAAAEMPEDPLKHEFGASVIATYKCAMFIIGALDDLQKALPNRTKRIFFIFSHALSSAVSLAGLVIWAPALPMATNALFELDRVHTIFQKAAENHRIRLSLPTITKLRNEAQASYAAYQQGKKQFNQDSVAGLSGLGGDTRLLKTTSESNKSTSSGSPSSSGSPETRNIEGLLQPQPMDPIGLQDVHPNIIKYLHEIRSLSADYPCPDSPPPLGSARSPGVGGLRLEGLANAPPSHEIQQSWHYFSKRLGV